MNRVTTALLVLLATAGQAHAAIITWDSPLAANTIGRRVAMLLREAKDFAAKRNYPIALAKLDDAESVKTTSGEATAIAFTRQSIEAKANDARAPAGGS